VGTARGGTGVLEHPVGGSLRSSSTTNVLLLVAAAPPMPTPAAYYGGLAIPPKASLRYGGNLAPSYAVTPWEALSKVTHTSELSGDHCLIDGQVVFTRGEEDVSSDPCRYQPKHCERAAPLDDFDLSSNESSNVQTLPPFSVGSDRSHVHVALQRLQPHVKFHFLVISDLNSVVASCKSALQNLALKFYVSANCQKLVLESVLSCKV